MVYNIFMKKLIVVLMLTALPIFADEKPETVDLNLNIGEEHGYKIFNPSVNDLSIKQKDEENEDYIYHPMEYVKNEARELFFNKK